MVFILSIELVGQLAEQKGPFLFQALTPPRSDNDMYDHMNNSVYSFLFVLDRNCISALIMEQIRLHHQCLPYEALWAPPSNL